MVYGDRGYRGCEGVIVCDSKDMRAKRQVVECVISQIKLFNAGSGGRTLTCVLVYTYAYAVSLHAKMGGYEKRVEDPEVRYRTNRAGIKTYKTFNGFPQLSDIELSFAFYAIGKVFCAFAFARKGCKIGKF